MCWKCFKNRVMGIAKITRNIEDMKIVLYLLRVTEHYYNIDEFKEPKGGTINE